MTEAEKAHFPKRILELAEDVQKFLGDSAVSRLLVNAVTGSTSPAYRQLKWESRNVTTDISSTISIPGDPSVRRLTPARMWHNASVIKTAGFVADSVREQGGVEAIAYTSNDITHVGTLPKIGATTDTLFNRLNDDGEVALGMRLGHSAVDAAMGIWIPNERHFIGFTSEIQHVAQNTPVSSFQGDFPGISLV